MSVLDLHVLRNTPLIRDPFDFVIVPGFIAAGALPALMAGYPAVSTPGSVPLSQLRYGDAFSAFVAELEGPAFRAAVEEKLNVDLAGRPTMITARGRCRAKDGKVHTDSATKIVTVLIYMNPAWGESGGRLRLLRSPDLEDVVAEVPPDAGTLLLFRRADNSWHGHQPFHGTRRALQMNWVTEAAVVERELARHSFTARLKRMNPFARRALSTGSRS